MNSFLASIHPDLNTGFFLLFLLSALTIGMSKAGLSGLGLVMVPLMALIFGARESTGIILPMLITADIMAVIYYRSHAVWKHILRVMPWAVAGIIIALITGNLINDNQFRIILLTVVWIMLILMLANDLRQKKGTEIPENHLFASSMGLTGGFSTMIGNAAGPVFTLYFLSMHLPKKEFIGTSAWLFLILNVSKLPLQAFVWNNITINTLKADLIAVPVIISGIFLGIWIVKLLPERVYRFFVIFATLTTSLLLFL
ncbi:MAG TPA: sulfite exporter TauE/SafE family protein [Bacteroidales bacterium]|nr:sulfite exporter TauE/SafE family protein [Bacteroidales bacterium]